MPSPNLTMRAKIETTKLERLAKYANQGGGELHKYAARSLPEMELQE